jgi:hypothetical protein
MRAENWWSRRPARGDPEEEEAHKLTMFATSAKKRVTGPTSAGTSVEGGEDILPLEAEVLVLTPPILVVGTRDVEEEDVDLTLTLQEVPTTPGIEEETASVEDVPQALEVAHLQARVAQDVPQVDPRSQMLPRDLMPPRPPVVDQELVPAPNPREPEALPRTQEGLTAVDVQVAADVPTVLPALRGPEPRAKRRLTAAEVDLATREEDPVPVPSHPRSLIK